LLRQLSGFESRPLSKIQNGRHKQRSGQHTVACQKKYKKDIKSSIRIHKSGSTTLGLLGGILKEEEGGISVNIIVAGAFDHTVSSADKTWYPLFLDADHHRLWDLSRAKKRAGPILSLFTR
jgi:hypothetical protein